MAYILSEQLYDDDHGDGAFARYQEYLASVREQFPARAYALATVVFVGGSFTTRGGQNILEPAAQGKPVLFGPHMENFRDSVAVLVGRGGIQVNDVEHLVRVMSDLLARPGSVESVGELARQAVRQISGASDRNVEALAELLP